MMSHHRQSERHACRLQVRLVDGTNARPALTENISRGGLFVRTDEFWVANALVRLHLTIPDEARPIALLGIVTRCEQASNHGPPGIGVSLFGNGEAVRARWTALVRRAGAAAAGWTTPLDAEDAVDAIRRAHTRRPCDLPARLATAAGEQAGRLLSASEGGIFVSVGDLLPAGAAVTLTVLPPDGEAVAVSGAVVRAADSLDPLEKGVGVRIAGDPDSIATWEAFMLMHVPLQRALPTFLPGVRRAWSEETSE